MICPRCNSNLSPSNNQGIEIDFCPNCKGVWLDKGELEKLIERSNVHESSNYSPKEFDNHNQHYDKHSGNSHNYDSHHEKSHNYDYKHNRKKGFLSDFFDF